MTKQEIISMITYAAVDPVEGVYDRVENVAV